MKNLIPVKQGGLSATQLEKLANITNDKIRLACKVDVIECVEFLGLSRPGDMTRNTPAGCSNGSFSFTHHPRRGENAAGGLCQQPAN